MSIDTNPSSSKNTVVQMKTLPNCVGFSEKSLIEIRKRKPVIIL